MQQTAFEGRFQGSEELLSLVGSLQAKLEILNRSFGFWEICTRYGAKMLDKNKQKKNSVGLVRVTSDDAEELLDPHVDVDPAEELVHVAPPLLHDRTGQRCWCRTVSRPLTGKDFPQPAEHQLQPLQGRKVQTEPTRELLQRMPHLLEVQQEGALVLAAAVLLHPLLDELVQDGGDGL